MRKYFLMDYSDGTISITPYKTQSPIESNFQIVLDKTDIETIHRELSKIMYGTSFPMLHYLFEFNWEPNLKLDVNNKSEGVEFRGKDIINGKWYYGSLDNRDPKHPYILYADKQWCEVNPNTIGQFINIRDRNGEKIYEGDIVSKIYWDIWHGSDKPSDISKRHKTTGIVIWDEWHTGFSIQKFSNEESRDILTPSNKLALLEKLGNAFDNPELFKSHQ